MGDMPCVWCLLWLNTAPERRPVEILAYPYGATAEREPEPVPVRGWAHAEELTYGGQFHIRESRDGTYFGLDAKTLVSGDACCIGHAVGALRSRVR
ncbi:hypothetical protein [Streptomyces collinus]|uniref:Uncharacterized protein n=1 Tax=Streptomyces collinus (strain DSM 40733 / Tue 365) TaxID=1214242 RepID=S5W1H9_STRC3|nr:hypothetical protein [Streptomyces collinus]AGS73930.1 hypothetical protein B446_35858 [Streptomyces collinus Tu 365]UJA06130.1 hypothetical protein HGI10_00090 [Streptomyces collinus]UJA12700.1 hypothetical protein HGI10_66850 [Streptomyces collinus]